MVGRESSCSYSVDWSWAPYTIVLPKGKILKIINEHIHGKSTLSVNCRQQYFYHQYRKKYTLSAWGRGGEECESGHDSDNDTVDREQRRELISCVVALWTWGIVKSTEQLTIGLDDTNANQYNKLVFFNVHNPSLSQV